MSVKLLNDHHLEFLSFKGGCTGWSESTLVKCHIDANHMPRLIYTSNKTFFSLLSGPEEQALQSIILEREVIHLEYYYICIFQKRPVRIFLESGSLRRKKSTMIAAIECQKNESHLCE